MFTKSFESTHGWWAHTLDPEEVCDTGAESGYHTRTHESGWTISGQIHEDYFVWVNEFEAHHPLYGKVYGDFEDKVHAETEAAFEHFVKHHEPNEWDYGDI